MADLYFSRDTRLYMVQKETNSNDKNVWVLPVMDGFGFSQATNTSEIALNEMADSLGNSRRGRKVFNDSLAPAEWSFSMYARPFLATKVAGNTVPATAGDGGWGDSSVHSCEEALWANFVAINNWDTTADEWTVNTGAVVNTAGSAVYGFAESNKTTLGTFDLYFILGDCSSDVTNSGYKIENCVINSVGVDFDIDGITTLNFSGFGGAITDVAATFDPETETGTAGSYIDEGTTMTDNFIRNRLTTLSLTAANDTVFPGAGSGAYSAIALTGGSINFENNITFLTPETLCQVSSPIGHVTGTRTIGGSFTAYLSASSVAGSSGDLFKALTSSEAKAIVTNEFDVTFAIGGAATPSVTINLPQCHIDIPTHSIEDTIAVETTFSALATDFDNPDEATITYLAP